MVYNFGIYEKGKYQAKLNGKHTKPYLVWRSMISRCYNPNYHGASAYEEVTVCEEWRYFQNFAEWFDKNYYEIDGEVVLLEKDFKTFAYGLDKNYSPNNCMFLPQSFNKILVFQHSVTKDLPVGVKETLNNRYSVSLEFKDCKNHAKNFKTKEEAYDWYLKEVYNHIIQKVKKYEGKIPKENIDVIYDFIKNDCLKEMHKMQKIKAE